MWVVLLGGGQYFAQVIHQSLDRQCFILLLALYYHDYADNPTGGCNVEEHGLFMSRGRQDRWSGQHLLELEESFVRLVVPLEKSGLLHELVQGKGLLTQPTDETAD